MSEDAEQIPLVDLVGLHAVVADDVGSAIARVLGSQHFVRGEEVGAFEREYAEFSETAHCVGTGNGTDAIELALRAAGVGDGDEVIIPANTFVGTAEGVIRAGAHVVLADCDAEYLLIDPEDVARRVTDRTRAVVPVHLYGQMAPMAALRRLADDAGLMIVEDAAQAHGARQAGNGPATLSVAATTSFYPSKNLGAYGDAGAVLTNDTELAGRIRALADHGTYGECKHALLGSNSRLDALQAAVLRAKLSRLHEWNEQRRAAAMRYDDMLADLEMVRRTKTMEGNEHVVHLYVVRVPERDRVLAELHRMGIGASVHYERPIHELGAFASLDQPPGSLPVAETASREVLSLPLYPGITPGQQEQVCTALRTLVLDHGA